MPLRSRKLRLTEKAGIMWARSSCVYCGQARAGWSGPSQSMVSRSTIR